MDGYTIQRILLGEPHTKKIFVGVYAADTLPRRLGRAPALLVANTHCSHLPGEHWVAFYIDCHRRGEYFDSYGRPPVVKSHRDFLQRNCTTWKFNTMCLQSVGSTVCGHYSVTYLLHRAHNFTLVEFVNDFFSGDTEKNDCIVLDLLKNYTKRSKYCHNYPPVNETCCARRK